MAKPKSLSVKVVLDNDKQLMITFDVLEDGWASVEKEAPGFYQMFRFWADEGAE
jgi:hypothetical protein